MDNATLPKARNLIETFSTQTLKNIVVAYEKDWNSIMNTRGHDEAVIQTRLIVTELQRRGQEVPLR